MEMRTSPEKVRRPIFIRKSTGIPPRIVVGWICPHLIETAVGNDRLQFIVVDLFAQEVCNLLDHCCGVLKQSHTSVGPLLRPVVVRGNTVNWEMAYLSAIIALLCSTIIHKQPSKLFQKTKIRKRQSEQGLERRNGLISGEACMRQGCICHRNT